jgi:hypothetical protein
MALAKATLTEITGQSKGEPKLGTPVPVQFNPATLKLSLSNQVDAQHTQGQQRRQFLGASSTTLSFDLVFDTADEGTDDAPVSVRLRTAMVERFLLPTDDSPSPPRVRFEWNELRLDGVVESLTIDFELFAADGTPLRAKMSVSIKEQNRKYQAAQLGPAARSGRNLPAPGRGNAGPGSSTALPGGPTAEPGDRTELALSGEAAAQFAARVGLDPAAWRGVAAGLDNPLAIGGGIEVSFDRSTGVAGALGVSVGVEAGASATLEQEFGLELKTSVPTRDGVALGSQGSAGFRLAAAGGLTPALDRVTQQQSEAAAATNRASFGPSVAGATAPPPPAAPAPPLQPRRPLRQTGLPGPTARRRAKPAPPLPTPDPRATAFGRGVPLRDRFSGAAGTRQETIPGGIILRPGEAPAGAAAPAASDPTAAPWTYLPAERVPAAEREARRALAGCSCRPACGGRGH